MGPGEAVVHPPTAAKVQFLILFVFSLLGLIPPSRDRETQDTRVSHSSFTGLVASTSNKFSFCPTKITLEGAVASHRYTFPLFMGFALDDSPNF